MAMIEYNTIQSSPSLMKTIVDSKLLIVFIHGFGGDSSTWDNFYRVIGDCADLDRLFDKVIYTYPTKMVKVVGILPSLKVIAAGLETEFEYRWKDYKNIVFVCHSMGGLVCRKFLVEAIKKKYRREDFPIRAAYFYGTPHKGSLLANIFMFFFPFYRQLTFLRIGSGGIRKINSQWIQLGISRQIRTKYIVGGKDWVVRPGSASFYKDNPDVATLPFCGHFNIHKPENEEDKSFIIFKTELLKILNDIIKESDLEDEDEEKPKNSGEDE